LLSKREKPKRGKEKPIAGKGGKAWVPKKSILRFVR